MSPLRETLVLLDELDLIEVKARAGIKIIDPDLEFLRDNMQFRIMIESQAIGVFTETVQDDWIDAQVELHKTALAALESGDDSTAQNTHIREFDRAFHREIVAALKNATISKTHEQLQTKLSIARQVLRRIPPRQANIGVMHDHAAILAALKARDLPAVRTALDAHFTASTHNTLVGY